MLRTKTVSFLLSLAALALAVPTFAPGVALADEAPIAAKAPQPRVTTTGRFQRYLLNPGGKPMGLLLSDGRFVPTPRHAMPADAPVLAAGDTLQIESVVHTTPAGTVLARAVVQRNGTVIADASQIHGRHHRDHQGAGNEQHARHPHAALAPLAVTGKIGALIAGHHGHIRAIVLEDGTTASAHGLETMGLKVGDQVALAGKGGTYPMGKALRIEKITLPNGQVRDIPPHAHRAPAESQFPT